MHKISNIHENSSETALSLTKNLNSLKELIPKKTCFLGWEGVIDYLYSIVESRDSINSWTRMESMKTFGDLILKVTGSSAGIECVLKRKTSGGFTSNICKAMNALRVKMVIVSSWGHPIIEETFLPFTNKEGIEILSFCNPGMTIGLEFNDGKIMITDSGNILNIDWNTLIQKISLESLINKIEHSNMLGLGYWASIPKFEDILMHLLNEVFPSINDLTNKLCFIDLADVKKRNKKDLATMLQILKKINEQVPLLLSLNDQEAIDILKILDPNEHFKEIKRNLDVLAEIGGLINKDLNLTYLVVHSPHLATISLNEEHFCISQAFTSNPRFTTSAGDHFNAATAIGLACGLKPPESILLGNAITSIFIRTGRSPNLAEVSKFISFYMNYVEQDNPNFP